MKNLLSRYGVYFAWVTAIIATCGSLYLSEVMGFIPCKLCWLQRIFMYPLSLLVGIACFTNDKKINRYALPMSIIGGSISVYHYFVQRFPSLESITPCQKGGEIPCNVDYLNWFGFITIPLLAFVAFLFITVFLILQRKYSAEMEQETGEEIE